MSTLSLQQAIDRSGGNPARMLRSDPRGPYPFPIPRSEYANWRDEQRVWRQSAILFDQSFHMSDVYFRGPDTKRLFSEVGVNSFAGFGRNRAKQFVAASPSGRFIGDAILFGLDEDEYALVGAPVAANWVQFHAETGDYDVEVTRDDAAPVNPGERLLFRYQVQGPAALEIVEAASGGTLGRIRFFHIGGFEIAGVPVRALNHTMVGTPGQEHTGLEIFGPRQHSARVKDALLEAGAPFGMVQGGALSYPTTSNESGWIARPLPAIYTGDDLKPYREYLPEHGFEAHASLAGSFVSDSVEDYYLTPYDLGYGRVVRFDHDFVGRDALKEIAARPSRRKVWLDWDEADTGRVLTSSLFGGGRGAKYLALPTGGYSILHYDRVLHDGADVGVAMDPMFTVNHGRVVSLATVDAEVAVDGERLTLVWGDEASVGVKPRVEPHRETEVGVTVRTGAAG
ncbi:MULTISPECIES: aminomethyltransferase family protein [unclassified Streptomyces]|uniref:aminomethyltransferase family protein n=1 Tax=unclassified Streptomyces TaxID=2593676 RepID=UPI0005254198|nr:MULTISPECIES: aminomethyltransferase family protein [unclassified Streptomyces]